MNVRWSTDVAPKKFDREAGTGLTSFPPADRVSAKKGALRVPATGSLLDVITITSGSESNRIDEAALPALSQRDGRRRASRGFQVSDYRCSDLDGLIPRAGQKSAKTPKRKTQRQYMTD